MGIYIIFGGCIVLAVVWMLMSLPVRRTAEPGVVLAFDIAATVLVIALFGAGTYAYVGQQNRMARNSRWRLALMTRPSFRQTAISRAPEPETALRQAAPGLSRHHLPCQTALGPQAGCRQMTHRDRPPRHRLPPRRI